MEEQLAMGSTETFFREVSNHLPFGYHVADLNGDILEINEIKLNWLGYPDRELVKTLSIKDILDEDGIRVYSEHIQLLKENGSAQNLDLTYRRADGKKLHALVSSCGVFSEAQSLCAVRTFAFNITELKKTHNNLKDSELTYRTMVEESPQMIFTADVQGRFTYVNNRLKKTIGYSDRDLLGKQFASIYDGEWRKKAIAFYQKQMLDKTEETTFLFPIIVKTGERLWIEQVARLIKKGNNVIGYRFAMHDITERLKTQETMEEAARLATEAKEMQQTFLGKMSHEIRTPMNGVVGMVNLLNTTRLTEEQQEFVDCIKESSVNMIRIINDILDVTKIQAGKLVFEETEFVLKNLVNSVIFTLKAVADQKNIQLISQIDSLIPDNLIADPVRLNQILLNLADNALKFTDKGSISITVLMKENTPNNIKLEFMVADTGIGIAPNKINAIFDSFTQAQSDTTRKYGGTGLGLTIAKQLIEQQNGEVRVTSKEGKGTTFTFTFNFKPVVHDSAAEKLKQENMKIHPLAGYHILLVEDNIMNQRVAKYTIEKWGAKMTIADCGANALELLMSNKYDLILMDIQMPEMNGLQATSKIRKELKCKTPIMAMTASVMQGERENCIKAGMNDYISKPFNPAELNQKIFSLITEEGALSNRKVVNVNYLRNAVGNDEEAVKEILEIYLSKTPVMLEELEMHQKAGNYAEVQSIVHNLKSSVGILGADNAHHTLDIIEMGLNHLPPTTEISEHLEKVKPQIRQSIREVVAEYKLLFG